MVLRTNGTAVDLRVDVRHAQCRVPVESHLGSRFEGHGHDDTVNPFVGADNVNVLDPERWTLREPSLEPDQVAKQVKPLKELLDLRTRLSDLRGSLQGNDKLDEMLLNAVGKAENLDKLKGEIGSKGPDGGSDG